MHAIAGPRRAHGIQAFAHCERTRSMTTSRGGGAIGLDQVAADPLDFKRTCIVSWGAALPGTPEAMRPEFRSRNGCLAPQKSLRRRGPPGTRDLRPSDAPTRQAAPGNWLSPPPAATGRSLDAYHQYLDLPSAGQADFPRFVIGHPKFQHPPFAGSNDLAAPARITAPLDATAGIRYPSKATVPNR